MNIRKKKWTEEIIENVKQQIHDLFAYSTLFDENYIDIQIYDNVEEVLGLAYVSNGEYPLLTMDTNHKLYIYPNQVMYISSAAITTQNDLMFVLKSKYDNKMRYVHAFSYLESIYRELIDHQLRTHFLRLVDINPFSPMIREYFKVNYLIQTEPLPKPEDFKKLK
jgi:hypothetical protein